MTKEKVDFSYWEPTDDLQVRIDAHKKYSIFSLEEYISNKYVFDKCNVIDVGCGNGNLTGHLSLNANLYIGSDKNYDSLLEARSKYSERENVLFIEKDMDENLFLPNDAFDYVFFVYSIYYSNNAQVLINRYKDSLRKGGKLIVIGPHDDNAWEVDDFCYRVNGKEKASLSRGNRIHDEFLPLLRRSGFTVTDERISFDVVFPNAEEYLRYITATLQYRDSYSGDINVEAALKILSEQYGLVLHKKSVVVCAIK